MKTKRRLIFPIAALASVLLALAFRISDKYFEMAKSLDIMAAVYRDLNAYYVDSISPSALMQTGIEAMAQSLDPYTYYFSEEELEDLNFQATGKYGGVGTAIRKINDSVVVSAVYADGPFEKAGIRAGDVILSLDDQPVAGMPLEEVSEQLRGDPGSIMTVSIKHPFHTNTSRYRITRQQIAVNSVAYAGLLADHTGYIKLVQFTEGTSEEITKAYRRLEKETPALNGLILDLRGNPGGLLEEAIKTANLFLPAGDTILTTRGKVDTWDRVFTATAQPLNSSIPLAILINGQSASASEIVAGAVQDLDRGIVVGQRSFGKGLVQTTRNLPYHTKLKITTARYYTPSGRCIQAIDYTQREADGSAAHIADSLKKDFHTKDGRTVMDAGGITPDKLVTAREFSDIAGSLIQHNLIFNYATRYVYRHQAPPGEKDFHLTDEDYIEFERYLEDHQYHYKTRTEAALERLRAAAKKEGYAELVDKHYQAMAQKLAGEKPLVIQKYKPEIRTLLETEIISRYYFQRGGIHQELPSDPVVQNAVKLLNSAGEYYALLHD